jgi:DNA-binding FadR family transcriptional regulator
MPLSRLSSAGYPRGGLHGQLVHELGRQILSGRLRPGDVLPQQLGLPVSRTVLREAVKVLAAKGLVEARPKTGTRVRPRQEWNLLDPDVLAWQQEDAASAASFLKSITEVRLVIEPAAAALAAQRAEASEIQVIDRAYREMEAALAGRSEDYASFDQADMRFHRAIVGASGNVLLQQIAGVVYSGLWVSFQATSRLPGKAKASLPKHRAILDAIRRRNGRLAQETMRRLVQATSRTIDGLSKRRRRSAGR